MARCSAPMDHSDASGAGPVGHRAREGPQSWVDSATPIEVWAERFPWSCVNAVHKDLIPKEDKLMRAS